MNPNSKIKKGISKLYTEIVKTDNNIPYGGKLYKNYINDIDKEYVKFSFGCANIIKHIDIKEKTELLDIGCGAGLDLILLGKKYKDLVSLNGIELTEALIKEALKNSEKENIKLNIKNSSAEVMEFDDNSFDLIISNAVIHLVEDKLSLFKEAYRTLKDNGQMIIADIVCTNEMPYDMKKAFKKSGGKFLYGGIIRESDYFKYIYEAGFKNVEVLDRVRFLPTDEAIKTFKKGFKRSDPKLKDISYFKRLEKELNNNHFFVLTYKVTKNLKNYEEIIEIECDNCNRRNKLFLYPNLNVTDYPIQHFLYFDEKINIIKCLCGKKYELNDMIGYHNMEHKIFANILPNNFMNGKSEEQKEYMKSLLKQELENRFKSIDKDYKIHIFNNKEELKQYLIVKKLL